MLGAITDFDFTILDFIRENWTCPFLDSTMSCLTHLGDAGVMWIVLTLLLLALPKYRRIGVALAIALIIDLILCNGLIKHLVDRPRPYEVRPYIELLIKPPSNASFPSGHAATALAATTVLFIKKNKLWIPAFIIALIISFSRLYLYVHYPTDVAAGIIFGILFGWLGALISAKFFDWWDNRKADKRGSAPAGAA